MRAMSYTESRARYVRCSTRSSVTAVASSTPWSASRVNRHRAATLSRLTDRCQAEASFFTTY